MIAKKRVSPLILGALIAALVAACTGEATPKASGDADGVLASDTSDWERVPKIQLLTKTAANDPTRFELSRLVVEMWNDAGIDAEVLPVSDAELNSRTFLSKDYDVYVIFYGGTPERLDPDNLLSRFHSANARPDGINVSMYRDEEYDSLYETQQTSSDERERVEAVRLAQKNLYDNRPIAPLLHPNAGFAYRSDRWNGIVQTKGYLFNVWNSTQAMPKDDRDTLVVGTTNLPHALNPVSASKLEDQLPLSHIYDTLLGIDPDGAVFDRAATNLEQDREVITFDLRDGMTFSDGNPVSASDVEFTIKYLADNDAPLYGSILKTVAATSSAGNRVTIELEEAAASFPTVALTQMPILPEHIWSAIDDPYAYDNSEPVGSGSFIVTNFDRGVSLTLAANEDHYDPPNISRIVELGLGSVDSAMGALSTGEIDMMDGLSTVAVQYQALRGEDGVEVLSQESHGWLGLHFNTEQGYLSNAHFRRALTYLISSPEIIDIVYQGEATPAGSVIAPALSIWHNDELPPFEQDRERALQELADGGFVFGDDGLLYAVPDE